MGLHRQFWVPMGAAATEGVYVRYPHDELWAVLSLLSHRYGVGIVGEDRDRAGGSSRSPRGARRPRALRSPMGAGQRGNGLRRLPPPRTVASLNTHDLAPFATFWREREPAVADDPIKMERRVMRFSARSREAMPTSCWSTSRTSGSKRNRKTGRARWAARTGAGAPAARSSNSKPTRPWSPTYEISTRSAGVHPSFPGRFAVRGGTDPGHRPRSLPLQRGQPQRPP